MWLSQQKSLNGADVGNLSNCGKHWSAVLLRVWKKERGPGPRFGELGRAARVCQSLAILGKKGKIKVTKKPRVWSGRRLREGTQGGSKKWCYKPPPVEGVKGRLNGGKKGGRLGRGNRLW